MVDKDTPAPVFYCPSCGVKSSKIIRDDGASQSVMFATLSESRNSMDSEPSHSNNVASAAPGRKGLGVPQPHCQIYDQPATQSSSHARTADTYDEGDGDSDTSDDSDDGLVANHRMSLALPSSSTLSPGNAGAAIGSMVESPNITETDTSSVVVPQSLNVDKPYSAVARPQPKLLSPEKHEWLADAKISGQELVSLLQGLVDKGMGELPDEKDPVWMYNSIFGSLNINPSTGTVTARSSGCMIASMLIGNSRPRRSSRTFSPLKFSNPAEAARQWLWASSTAGGQLLWKTKGRPGVPTYCLYHPAVNNGRSVVSHRAFTNKLYMLSAEKRAEIFASLKHNIYH